MQVKLVLFVLLLSFALLSAKWVWTEGNDPSAPAPAEAAAASHPETAAAPLAASRQENAVDLDHAETLEADAQQLRDEDRVLIAEKSIGIVLGGVREYGQARFPIEKMSKITGWAGTAEAVGNVLLKVFDMALSHTARGAQLVMVNDDYSQTARLQFTHSYQMNRWDGQFAGALYPYQTHQCYIETGYAFGNYYRDTNAEAQYSIYCPKNGQNVRFEVRIRQFDAFEVYLYDHWNPCYEIHIGGQYKDIINTGYGNIEKSISEPLFRVYKIQQFPHLYTTLRVHIKTKTDSDSPVFFEHCDFGGKEKPVTGSMPYIGGDWNDKVSSMLIPPGYSVAVYEHSYYSGRVQVYSNDCACMVHQDMNDKLSSFRVFKLVNGNAVEVIN